MITEPAQFTTEKKKWRHFPKVFVIFSPSVDSKYWASHTITGLDGKNYDGILMNVSAISSKIDRDGGFATVGGLTIDLNNLEDYSDWLKTTPDIEGSICEFYLIFDDGTALVLNEAVKFFTGLVDAVEVDYSNIAISVSHKDLFNKTLVGDLITEDIATLPDSIGRMKPIIYGDHTFNGIKPTASFDPDEVPKLVPCIELGSGKFLVAGHELDAITSASFYIYNRRLNRFFKVDESYGTFTIDNPDANDDCVLTYSYGETSGGGESVFVAWDAWLPTSARQTYFTDEFGFDNIENAVDRSMATYAEIDDTLGADNFHLTELYFPEYDNDFEILQIRCYSRQDVGGSGVQWLLHGDMTVDKKAIIIDASDAGNDHTFLTLAEHDFVAGELVRFEGIPFALTNPGYSVLNGRSFTIKSVDDNYHFTIEAEVAYPAWPALYFGTAIVDGLTTSVNIFNTYGTPQDVGITWSGTRENVIKPITLSMRGDGAVEAKLFLLYKYVQLKMNVGGDNVLCASVYGKPDEGASYFKNPADIIKDLSVTHGGLSADDFDAAAFSATQTARTNWKFNPYIAEQKYINEWIHDLAKKSNVFIFWSNDNKLKLAPYVIGASTIYTSGIDTFSEEPTQSGTNYTQNPVKKDSLKITKTNLGEVINKIYVDYSTSYITNLIYRRETVQNQESQALYGVLEKIFENPYTSDANTAKYYGANLIDIFAYRLWQATLQARLSAFHVEIGDVIDVHNLISEDFKFRVHAVGFNPLSGLGWINIECVEARDLSGDTVTSVTSTRTDGKGGLGGQSIGGYIGGGISTEQVHFRGRFNKSIRGIVFYDQYGQPVYEWRENSGKDKLVRQTSYVKP